MTALKKDAPQLYVCCSPLPLYCRLRRVPARWQQPPGTPPPPVPERLWRLVLSIGPPLWRPQDEGGGNRNNNNRLMDTQNNAKGGYGYGGDANNKARTRTLPASALRLHLAASAAAARQLDQPPRLNV